MKKIPLIKNIVLLLVAITAIAATTSAQLTVTPGVHLTSSGSNTQIVLHSIGLTNNGTINHTSGKF